MVKMSKTKQMEAVALMCQSDEAKALRELLAKVGDKWSILIIVVISKAPEERARFSELLKSIHGISQRMLTSTLRNLERDGFLTREVFPEVPPRVEYQLTSLGRSLLVPMQGLVSWVGANWPAIKKARDRFDSSSKSRA